MTERSFGEMIAYFNRRVAGMDINPGYKMELLGMVTALGFKHESPRRSGFRAVNDRPGMTRRKRRRNISSQTKAEESDIVIWIRTCRIRLLRSKRV